VAPCNSFAPMADRGWVAAAGLGLALAVVASVVVEPRERPAPEDAFLQAWERSRLGTYVVASTFTRRLEDGRELSASTSVAQRPPRDRLVLGLGAVEGRLDGRVIRCASDAGATVSCFTGPPAPPYEEEVATEIERLEGYVAGERPLYRVERRASGCFVLVLALDLPSPPYGRRATFCFDRETGAPTRTVIERDEAVDTTVADSIRPEVTDADLALPEEPGPTPGG
jgi:hypothetical protein